MVSMLFTAEMTSLGGRYGRSVHQSNTPACAAVSEFDEDEAAACSAAMASSAAWTAACSLALVVQAAFHHGDDEVEKVELVLVLHAMRHSRVNFLTKLVNSETAILVSISETYQNLLSFNYHDLML